VRRLTTINAVLLRGANAVVMQLRLLIVIVCGVCGLNTRAQNLLPNPGFEAGMDEPFGWRQEGNGAWSTDARAGRGALAVQGNGDDQSLWRTKALALTAGGLYRLQFHARRESGASGGSAIAGLSRVNRDFRLGADWREISFIFAVPAEGTNDYARLGQWHVKGRVAFDDVELAPVIAAHTMLADGTELGEAESVRGGVYRFNPKLGWMGANFHRPLFVNRATFNSDRWVFSPGAEVVYRLALGEHAQMSAQVRVAINFHTAGALNLEASRDQATWRALTNFDGQRRGGTVALPSELFPAKEIFIRLSQSGAGGGFQVNTFDYAAALAEPVPDAEGSTHFLQVTHRTPELAVHWKSLRQSESDGQWQLDFALTNLARTPIDVRGVAWLDAVTPPPVASRTALQVATSGTLSVPCAFGAAGPHVLNVLIEDGAGRPLFSGRTDVRLGFLSDPRPGYWLAQNDGLGVWWCESGWKVGRDHGLPERPSAGRVKPASIAAARGEYEPVQVVLRPDKDGQLLSATVAPLRNARGDAVPIDVRIDEVAYVQVTQPTDESCLRGWYPDPLPPLRTPLALRAGQNQPLWLTFHVSRKAAAGDYHGELELKTTLGTTRVPLVIHVHDFALPEETHLKSALGLGTREINRYHKLTRTEDKQAVFEKYLKNFAEHRISPYSFSDYAPIEIRFVDEGTNQRAQIDFTKFDQAAAKWLDQFHFSTFQLRLQGMGGGTFHSRHLGKLEGFEEGTPEHARLFQDYLSQIERHLRERGWLSKAFTYWFDEPDPKDYDFVVAGMKRIKNAAPGVRRMLTEQPEEKLFGHVEIWCGLTPEWTPEKVRARRDAGEEVWWYICTGPKAPYVTEFIDHPGTELRLWPWQSWQYGVEGILIWATIYWNSSAAFPPPKIQDPWNDPMSYVSGYSFGPGHVGYWGNGDGRFLYPPRRDPAASTEPNLDEPINSLRWENLRDGMEDYEYFWLLQQAIAQEHARGRETALVKEARALLAVPSDISKDLTHFTTDPRPLLEHRARVARMIERLQAAVR